LRVAADGINTQKVIQSWIRQEVRPVDQVQGCGNWRNLRGIENSYYEAQIMEYILEIFHSDLRKRSCEQSSPKAYIMIAIHAWISLFPETSVNYSDKTEIMILMTISLTCMFTLYKQFSALSSSINIAKIATKYNLLFGKAVNHTSELYNIQFVVLYFKVNHLLIRELDCWMMKPIT